MSWKLPPLPALRVFEAAARLGNFTLAARELGMTQAAVSYQIKVLEERVGGALFIRTARRVVLTPIGERMASRASDAFSILAESFSSAKSASETHLVITTVQTFASGWLSERLGSYRLLNPKIMVSVDTSMEVADLLRGEQDVAIRVGGGAWQDMDSCYLFAGNYAPFLSPRLMESVKDIRKPSDLYQLPFLGHTDPWWSRWFEAAGAEFEPDRVIPGPDLRQQNYEAVAAVAGQGIAMLTSQLYRTHLSDGRLYQPFPVEGSDGQDYWLVYPHSRRNVPKIKSFKNWIIEETRSMR